MPFDGVSSTNHGASAGLSVATVSLPFARVSDGTVLRHRLSEGITRAGVAAPVDAAALVPADTATATNSAASATLGDPIFVTRTFPTLEGPKRTEHQPR